MYLLLGLSVSAVAGLLCTYLARPDARIRLLDVPNARSMHGAPIPRTGGLALLIAMLFGWLVQVWLPVSMPPDMLFMAMPLLLVALISYLDDSYDLSARVRLVAHLCAGLSVIAFGPALSQLWLPGVTYGLPAALGAILTLLYVGWMINLYNFMDGLDGLAAGMAVCGFGALFVAGLIGDHAAFALFNLVIAAAAGGFLLLNLPPARLFMGDAGSTSLGFLAAVSSLWGDVQGLIPLWVSVLIFSPFIVDASMTLVFRLIRRENLFQAHQCHWYQRLVHSGLGPGRTLVLAYAVMLACSVSAVAALSLGTLGQWSVVAFWLLVYSLLLTRYGAGIPHRSQ